MMVESLPPEFVASMVIEAVLKTAFGVPVIDPVVELSESPDGSEPLVIDQEVDWIHHRYWPESLSQYPRSW